MLSNSVFQIIPFVNALELLSKEDTTLVDEKKLKDGSKVGLYIALDPYYMPFVMINKTVFAFTGGVEAIDYFKNIKTAPREPVEQELPKKIKRRSVHAGLSKNVLSNNIWDQLTIQDFINERLN